MAKLLAGPSRRIKLKIHGIKTQIPRWKVDGFSHPFFLQQKVQVIFLLDNKLQEISQVKVVFEYVYISVKRYFEKTLMA